MEEGKVKGGRDVERGSPVRLTDSAIDRKGLSLERDSGEYRRFSTFAYPYRPGGKKLKIL